MTSLDVLLGVVGVLVTLLVIAGMVLITPREKVDLHAEGSDPQGSNLSGAKRPRPAGRRPASRRP
jgi:hypothetical protein